MHIIIASWDVETCMCYLHLFPSQLHSPGLHFVQSCEDRGPGDSQGLLRGDQLHSHKGRLAYMSLLMLQATICQDYCHFCVHCVGKESLYYGLPFFLACALHV